MNNTERELLARRVVSLVEEEKKSYSEIAKILDIDIHDACIFYINRAYYLDSTEEQRVIFNAIIYILNKKKIKASVLRIIRLYTHIVKSNIRSLSQIHYLTDDDIMNILKCDYGSYTFLLVSELRTIGHKGVPLCVFSRTDYIRCNHIECYDRLPIEQMKKISRDIRDKEIIQLINSGAKHSDIARKYNMSLTNVTRIYNKHMRYQRLKDDKLYNILSSCSDNETCVFRAYNAIKKRCGKHINSIDDLSNINIDSIRGCNKDIKLSLKNMIRSMQTETITYDN